MVRRHVSFNCKELAGISALVRRSYLTFSVLLYGSWSFHFNCNRNLEHNICIMRNPHALQSQLHCDTQLRSVQVRQQVSHHSGRQCNNKDNTMAKYKESEVLATRFTTTQRLRLHSAESAHDPAEKRDDGDNCPAVPVCLH